MGLDSLIWFCRPEENGIWAKTTASALGAYTPCGIESVVGCISNVVLMGLCLYRTWLLMKDFKLQRFSLRSKFYNYMLAFSSGYSAAESLFRLLFNVSMYDFSAQSSLPPFEVVSLVIETLCWSSFMIMTLLETKVYIREFRWYVRFGVLYVLVGDAVKLSAILSIKDLYPRAATESNTAIDEEDDDDEHEEEDFDEDPDPQDLEYVSQIKRVLELLKKNRDMLFSEVNEGKIPRDRVALQMLPEEMVQWPNLEVEATKKGPRKSLYATKII